MTGLERNSQIVTLASYAPLFVHAENHGWATNLINIDNHRCAGPHTVSSPSQQVLLGFTHCQQRPPGHRYQGQTGKDTT